MVRGLIFGVIWGGIVTALFLAVVSLLAPMPDPEAEPMVEEMVQEAPVSTPGVMPVDDPTPTPQMSSPSIEDSPSLAETTSAIVPSTGAPESDLVDVSETNEDTPSVSEGDAPASVASTSEAPAAPMNETAPLVSVETVEIASEATGDEAIGEAVDELVTALEADQNTSAFQPVAPLTEDTSIVTDRLPTVSTPQADTPEPAAVADEDNRPLMSIILIDTGEFNIGPEALASFPYPLSFAIDPLREDAIDVAQAYSDKGIELLITADLPENGDSDLASVALAPTLESIPGVDGILEGTNGGLQGNMDMAEGVLNLIAGTGHGLVLRPKGLNATLQQGEGRGLAVDVVFRDFDAQGQDATVIRRFLDQAAFKARQEGEVIMVGRLRPATISALLLWGLQDRASSVRLAPISEVLAQ